MAGHADQTHSTMRLFFWNILHGGGSNRIPEIALALVGSDADAIVVAEFRTTMGGQLRGVLADHGWEHQACTDPPEGRNGLLIASRRPIAPLDAPASPGQTSPAPPSQRLLAVRFTACNTTLLAAHVPPLEARDGEAQEVWRRLIDLAAAHAATDTLILGDLNAGRFFADEAGTTGPRRLHKDPPALQRVGAESLGRLALLGYADAWRAANTRENAPISREFTWFSHLKRGVRIDHALASRSLLARVTGVRYGHSLRETSLSDHAPVVVDISESA